MISRYLERAIARACFEELPDGRHFATIKGCPGVWASGTTRDQCQAELLDTLKGWLFEKLQHGDDIPSIDDIAFINPSREFMRRGDVTIALSVTNSDEDMIDEFILDRFLRIVGIDEEEWNQLGECSNPNSH